MSGWRAEFSSSQARSIPSSRETSLFSISATARCEVGSLYHAMPSGHAFDSASEGAFQSMSSQLQPHPRQRWGGPEGWGASRDFEGMLLQQPRRALGYRR